MDSHIRVSMFDDRIEVVSPGGLPSGITAEEYFSGKLSVLTTGSFFFVKKCVIL